MGNADLAFMAAGEMAGRIRAGEISAVEATECALERIQASRETLNAFIAVMPEEARAAARNADAAVARGDDLGPLHGVPVSIKDLINVKGVATTFGSALMTENIAPADAVAVARLRAAGAVIIGKTTTPDIAH